MMRNWCWIVAFSGFMAVALGAFGAHGLKTILTPTQLATWQTANFYHFIHTLVVLVLIVKPLEDGWYRFSVSSFLLGILLFSGSLYFYAISQIAWLPILTPIGGVIWLLAWLSLSRVLYVYNKSDAGAD